MIRKKTTLRNMLSKLCEYDLVIFGVQHKAKIQNTVKATYSHQCSPRRFSFFFFKLIFIFGLNIHLAYLVQAL